jgi:competence protein ComK
LFFVKMYKINPNFMCMCGVLDRYGKLCTIVRETKRIIIVDRSPLEILNDTIRCVGYNLKGAMETAKLHMGNNYMCPLMVNPVYNIVVFPSRTAKHIETIWFNPLHITRTNNVKSQTQVKFTNESTIIVPVKLCAFNNRLKKAEQFRDMMKIAA